MSAARELEDLSRAVAGLLAAGPAPERLGDPRQAQAALVCRDTITAELRAVTRTVLRIGAAADGVTAPRPELTLLTTSPAHALHAALDALPAATGRDLPLTDALAVPGGPVLAGWQDAARAAASLERHHDRLEELAGPDAWQVLRDTADLAAALPHLDGDLAAALPPGHPREHARLLDPPSHTLTRLAAQQLRDQTADLPAHTPPGSPAAGIQPRPSAARAAGTRVGSGAAEPPGAQQAAPSPEQGPIVKPVQTLADLPDATRRLTALVRGRGADLTTAEAAAVSRTLADGLALTARVLHADQPVGGAGAHDRHSSSRAAAAAIEQALPGLQHVATGRLASLTAPAPPVLDLAARIRERLRAAAVLVHRLEREPASAGDVARLAPALTAWAEQTPAAAAAVSRGLHLAADSNRLVAPRTDSQRGRAERLLWLPLRHARKNGLDPTLTAAAAASSHLTATESQLRATAEHWHGQSSPTVGTRPTGLTERPSNARAAMTAALQGRTPTGSINYRPPHPAAARLAPLSPASRSR